MEPKCQCTNSHLTLPLPSLLYLCSHIAHATHIAPQLSPEEVSKLTKSPSTIEGNKVNCKLLTTNSLLCMHTMHTVHTCCVYYLMSFLYDSLEDEILLQADDPLVTITHLPGNEPPASGLEPAPSPNSSFPIGDLALQSPQERGKGQPRTGNQLSQEPAHRPTTTHITVSGTQVPSQVLRYTGVMPVTT